MNENGIWHMSILAAPNVISWSHWVYHGSLHFLSHEGSKHNVMKLATRGLAIYKNTPVKRLNNIMLWGRGNGLPGMIYVTGFNSNRHTTIQSSYTTAYLYKCMHHVSCFLISKYWVPPVVYLQYVLQYQYCNILSTLWKEYWNAASKLLCSKIWQWYSLLCRNELVEIFEQQIGSILTDTFPKILAWSVFLPKYM